MECSEEEGVTHLTLHIRNLVKRERILIKRNFRDLQESQETQFTRQEEQQTPSGLPSSRRSSNSVNVISRVVRRVELNDPVDLGNIESSSGDVGTEEDPSRRVTEFEEGVGSLLLLLLSLRFTASAR